MERGDGADTPDSHHTSTPSLGPKNLQTSLSLNSAVGTLNKDSRDEDPPAGETNKLPLPSSSRPLPSINGEVGSEDGTLLVPFYLISHTQHFNCRLSGHLQIQMVCFVSSCIMNNVIMLPCRICARCGISFTGTWYDKQRKKPCCPNCWGKSGHSCRHSKGNFCVKTITWVRGTRLILFISVHSSSLKV